MDLVLLQGELRPEWNETVSIEPGWSGDQP